MMTIDYPWYMILPCLLAGVGYAAVLYALRPHAYGRGLRWVLAALRCVVVAALAFLLLAPMVRHTATERQRPVVLLAEDASLSVRSSADSAFSLEPLGRSLDGQCEWTLRQFAEGRSTNLADGLALPAGVAPAAIVLASDGIHNRGANPVNVAEGLPCPVYTIALGDTTPRRDAAVGALRCNRVAMLGNRFTVELTATATLLRGSESRLTVTDDRGRQLAAQPVRYEADDYSTTLAATLPADEPGLHRYTATLAPVAGEHTADNNSLTFYVDIIDNRQHVALIANAPHPDIGALKRAIESNPYYEVTVLTADEAEDPRWEADDYSLAVLHNLPSARHPSVAYAERLPRMYVIGTATDLPRFNALHTGLEIISKASRTNEVTALWQEHFTLFGLDADEARGFESLPPLAAPFGEARLAPGVQTLFNARLGNIDTRQPLVAATSHGAVRQVFVWGEGLWRWRMACYRTYQSHDRFDRLLSQIVTYASLQAAHDRLQVVADRSYEEGEAVTIDAQLYDDAYELTNDPDVTLALRSDSVQAEYPLFRTANAYRYSVNNLPAGLYRYTATATYDGTTYTAEGSFAVEATNLELRSTVADHTLLRTISAVSGGRTYSPDQVDDLREVLVALKPTLYTHTRYADLLNLPAILVLLLLLLAAEWFIRKYNGTL